MKKHLLLVCLLILGIFTGCKSDNGDYVGLKQLGIDKSKGYFNNHIDTHGGFLGDGCTYIEIEFNGDYTDTIINELKENDKWSPLPLTKNLHKAVYGDEDFESLLSIDDSIPAIPEITNGYYYFKDRHSESKDNSDDTYLFSRYSFNFDIIIYDTDSHILYIFQLDT